MIETPNLVGSGDEAVKEIQRYLFMLAEQLNFELQSVEKNTAAIELITGSKSGAKTVEQLESQNTTAKEKTALETFNEIKSLIAKSADIVEAYGQTIQKSLSSELVMGSEFGEYIERSLADIEASAQAITQTYKNKQQEIDGTVYKYILVNGQIKSGYLGAENGVPIYGVEVGQTSEFNGEKIFNGFARFTANELAFYGGGEGNRYKLAYFSNTDLFINKAKIINELTIGHYSIAEDSGYGISFNWKGV